MTALAPYVFLPGTAREALVEMVHVEMLGQPFDFEHGEGHREGRGEGRGEGHGGNSPRPLDLRDCQGLLSR